MIAQAIVAGQEEIIIDCMVLQLNQEVVDDEEEAEATEVIPPNLLSGLLLNQQTSEFHEEFEHADGTDDTGVIKRLCSTESIKMGGIV
jgi:hypothetical protein